VTDPTGPHLAVAVICERVIQEQDGGVTAVRIIDRITFLTLEGSERQPQPIWFLIKLTAGAARGSGTIRVEVEKPSTERGAVLEGGVFFEGEDRGVVVAVNAQFAPPEAGLYWYDVYYNDERLTRIPLRAIFQSIRVASDQ
jgi:hypothetical protein